MPVGVDLIEVTAPSEAEMLGVVSNGANYEFWGYTRDGYPLALILSEPKSTFNSALAKGGYAVSGAYVIFHDSAQNRFLFDVAAGTLSQIDEHYPSTVTLSVFATPTATGFIEVGSALIGGNRQQFVRNIGRDGSLSTVFEGAENDHEKPIPWTTDLVVFGKNGWTGGDARPITVNVSSGADAELSSTESIPTLGFYYCLIQNAGFSQPFMLTDYFETSGVDIVSTDAFTGSATPPLGGSSNEHVTRYFGGSQMALAWTTTSSPPTLSLALMPRTPSTDAPTEFVTVRPTDYVAGSSDGSAASLPFWALMLSEE